MNFSHWVVNESQQWISVLTSAVHSGARELIKLGIFAGLIGLVSRRFPRAVWAVILAYPLLGASAAASWREFWVYFGIGEFQLLLTIALVVRLWRFNIVLIFSAYALTSLFGSLALLWFKGGPFYQWQVMPVLGICLGLVLLVAALHWRWARMAVVSTRTEP
jgi:hypothetical protein